MLEPAAIGVSTANAFIQSVLPGMPKRRVAQIMGQRNGLDQIFVQPKRTRDGTPQLRHFQ